MVGLGCFCKLECLTKKGNSGNFGSCSNTHTHTLQKHMYTLPYKHTVGAHEHTAHTYTVGKHTQTHALPKHIHTYILQKHMHTQCRYMHTLQMHTSMHTLVESQC